MFLDLQINVWQWNMLSKATLVILKVMKGRPTVQYCVQKFRGDKFWYRDNDSNNYCSTKYITYFQNEQHKHFFNAASARERFFADSEYISLKLSPAQACYQQKYIVKRFRRKASVLRRPQLEIMERQDRNLIYEHYLMLDYCNVLDL